MSPASFVPHLTTSLTGSLSSLEKIVLDNEATVEAWFRDQWQKTAPPWYGSVDLRNAGFKLAPIDTNLFPAGFNNLNPDSIPLAAQAVRATIAETCPDVTRLLLVPESHSRNVFYFESLATLLDILSFAAIEVRIASLDPALSVARQLKLPSGRTIMLEPLQRKANQIGVGDFYPDAVVLNNDLSEGIPAVLQSLEQRVLPPLELGWSKRLKSAHFTYYQQVCTEFAVLLKCDSWLFNPLFDKCPEVNFMTQQGQRCLYKRAQQLLHNITYKYEQYGIDNKPFLVIKADAGTYGMAVMMIENAEQLLTLNRKQRTRMSTIKGGQSVTKAIIQEGVYSFDTSGVAQSVAEPVVYTIGCQVIGGFYRVHDNKAENESLNSPGMTFAPLPFTNAVNSTNRFYPYGVVARLALLAAARESAALVG